MQRAMSNDDLILGEIVSKSYYLEDSVTIIIIIPQTFDTQFYVIMNGYTTTSCE